MRHPTTILSTDSLRITRKVPGAGADYDILARGTDFDFSIVFIALFEVATI